MAKFSHGRRRSRTLQRSRRRSLAGLLMGTACMVLLPAALVWACAPSIASLAFDRTAYRAGDTVAVKGGGFKPSNPVELTLQPPSGAAQSVAPAGLSTNGEGYFEASFALSAAAEPGDYVLQAKTDPSGQGHGGQTTPTVARDTFKVMGEGGSSSSQQSPSSNVAAAAPLAKVALSQAIAKCKKKHRARKTMAASKKRKLAKRRAACIKKARKKYP
jgi:uncharacterized protein YfaS (alpha-2-macroglobulin family)